MLDIINFLGLALVLGFRHSYDADHLIAVSNFLVKVKTFNSSIKIVFSWAIGHMVTIMVITILLYIFKEFILKNIFSHFEKIVGIVIMAIGIFSLKDFFIFHKHKHKHVFGIGIIQGLASNNELLLLLTASLEVSTLGSIVLGIGIFSIGVVLGMIIFTMILTYPIIRTQSQRLNKFAHFITGTITLFYGVWIFV